MSNLATNYGGGQGSGGGGYGSGYGGESTVGRIGHTSGHASGSQSFAMKTLSRSKIQTSTLQSRSVGDYTADCYPAEKPRQRPNVGLERPASDGLKPRGGDGVSVDSDDSQRMIIRKDVTWQVNRGEDSADL